MTEQIDFTMFFGDDNELLITADVTPADPGRSGASVTMEDSTPPSDGEVEIIQCHLILRGTDTQEIQTVVAFDPHGIGVYEKRTKSYVSLTELISDAAHEEITYE